MDEIDWSDRLIGIKGARGVGKTTFLLQYAKEHFLPGDHSCLYINTNNFYVQNVGIVEFAEEFYHSGGKVLLLCIAGMFIWGIFIWYAQYLVMQATNDLATDYNSKHYADVFEGTERSHEN
jgi:GTPase SAR1 family protein